MQTQKFKETEMPLLNRKRIKFEIDHLGTSTPSKSFIKEGIAKKYNIKSDLIAIRHIYTRFGQQRSRVIAHIYQDEKTLKFLEPPKGKKTEPKKKAAK